MAQLFSNVGNLTWQQAVMWLIGGILIYLAVKRDMEPALLLPTRWRILRNSVIMPISFVPRFT